ncbi:MAG: hypothetical protein V1659_01520 [Candidatus Woesearchaeota archaeon]
MKPKKAQASLDYLFTYGWVILGLAVVLGALVYFNVLNPSVFVSEKCDFGPQLECTDYFLTEKTLSLKFRNNFGKDIIIEEIASLDDGIAIEACNEKKEIKLAAGTETGIECEVSGEGIHEGEKEKLNIQIIFRRADSDEAPKHEIAGQLLALVEAEDLLVVPFGGDEESSS